ncbi:hypothetical protein C8J56DRAFT_1117165 [Mycena floridula]|nr:hypothetical protein C8J56DRAFT_1117165 [Mycena floridula]
MVRRRWFPVSLSRGFLYILFGLLARQCHCATVTIDDTLGDPTTGETIVYSERWNVGQDCDVCAVHPDKTQTYQGTWHDSTYDPNQADILQATVKFSGTSVSVFGVIFVDQLDVHPMSLLFSIDSEPAGTFSRTMADAAGATGYQYHVPFYTNQTLSPGDHTLTIHNGIPGGPASLLLLDYITYESPDSKSDNGAATSAPTEGPTRTTISHSLTVASTIKTSDSTHSSSATRTSTSVTGSVGSITTQQFSTDIQSPLSSSPPASVSGALSNPGTAVPLNPRSVPLKVRLGLIVGLVLAVTILLAVGGYCVSRRRASRRFRSLSLPKPFFIDPDRPGYSIRSSKGPPSDQISSGNPISASRPEISTQRDQRSTEQDQSSSDPSSSSEQSAPILNAETSMMLVAEIRSLREILSRRNAQRPPPYD